MKNVLVMVSCVMFVFALSCVSAGGASASDDPNVLMWTDCDTFNGFHITDDRLTMAIDRDEKTQGAASVRWSEAAGASLFFNDTRGKDIRNFQYFEFDLWIEDPALFQAAPDWAITIFSQTSDNTNNRRYWQKPELDLQPGWNSIKLDLDTGIDSNGGLIPSAVRRFRFFVLRGAAFVDRQMTFRIDNIRFTNDVQEGESS